MRGKAAYHRTELGQAATQPDAQLGAPQPEREWVGLRPGRRSVRLEYEEAQIKEEGAFGATLRVVHNYGKSTCFSLLAQCCPQ